MHKMLLSRGEEDILSKQIKKGGEGGGGQSGFSVSHSFNPSLSLPSAANTY